MVHVQAAEGGARCMRWFFILGVVEKHGRPEPHFEIPKTELTKNHPRALHPTRGKAPRRRRLDEGMAMINRRLGCTV